MSAGVYIYHKERRLGRMYFLVVYYGGSGIISEKATRTQLLNKYEFGNYAGDVVQFTQRAGIGSFLQVGNCVIIRIG